MSNEDHFKLRDDYRSETGRTAFCKKYTKHDMVIYANWLEKRLVKNLITPDISNQRELLIAAFKWFIKNKRHELNSDYTTDADDFLSNL